MGTRANYALIITGNTADVERARTALRSTVGGVAVSQVSDMIHGRINHKASIVVVPDGSQEGRDEAVATAEFRDAVITWLRDARRFEIYLDWAEVRFGAAAEDLPDAILRSSRLDTEATSDGGLAPAAPPAGDLGNTLQEISAVDDELTAAKHAFRETIRPIVAADLALSDASWILDDHLARQQGMSWSAWVVRDDDRRPVALGVDIVTHGMGHNEAATTKTHRIPLI